MNRSSYCGFFGVSRFIRSSQVGFGEVEGVLNLTLTRNQPIKAVLSIKGLCRFDLQCLKPVGHRLDVAFDALDIPGNKAIWATMSSMMLTAYLPCNGYL